MAWAALLLVALFPLALTAQEKDPGFTQNQIGMAGSTDAHPWSTSDHTFPAGNVTATDFGLMQNPNSGQPRSGKPGQPPKPATEPKPHIPASMVGYIDDAIVGSQVRIRFDAAFHNNAPDRAEFFYAQCSCISSSAPGPNSGVADLNFQQLYLYAEYAPAKRLSLFVDVPVRWLQPLSIPLAGTPQLMNEGGLSDVSAGFKFAALASDNHYLTFQFQGYFPTGNAATGLGTNHYTVEPALLYYQRISDRLALEGQVGDSHPIGGSYCPNPCNSVAASSPVQAFSGDVFFYGFGPSYIVYRGEKVQVAPVIELVGWRVLGGFVTDTSSFGSSTQTALSAEGTNIANLKVGARTMVGLHSSFYIGYGHQVTHAIWYKEIVRAEYRYSF